ncbi:hypothetical protein [Ferribacterium limneticum]|uniref:hypothetical protein n=1 Tax=Ferribacterium limneticum TaxID=76259 RepID=UPI001CF7F0E3|nr:hypothetical protein [Ferribacterium limneticum]UCV26773.1 hypothetical protein KI617_10670 [Ferribacterium limneticum]UCV30690.1 hypothetical protein KI608_10670 [Ferribacterium limneticum]
MKKHLDTTLTALALALGTLSDDLYGTYWANYRYTDEPEPESDSQLELLAMARTATAMRDVITIVWRYDRKELRNLLANPDYEAIHAVLQEVLAIKEQAAARHRQRKAEEARAAFSLQARFHMKEANHG